MSLTTEITEVVERIATEFKTVRAEIAAGGGDFLPLAGGQMSGPLMIDTGIEGMATIEISPFQGIGFNDPTTGGYSLLGGGSLTLTTGGNSLQLQDGQISSTQFGAALLPTQPEHLTTKSYVDAAVAGASGGGAVIDDTTPSTTTVYSSSKVDSLVDGAALVTAFEAALNS